MDKNDSNLNEDYLDFLGSESKRPPLKLKESIASFVHKELNPSFLKVFARLFSIQAIVGFVTLLICPQFEVAIANNQQVVVVLERYFGMHGCMAICGAIFVGSGALVASFLMKPEEIRKVRVGMFYEFPLIALIALLAFFILNQSIMPVMAVSWIIGASLAGILFFYSGFRFRMKDEFALSL